MPQAPGSVIYFPKQSKPTPTPKVKAPFLIETKEWDSPTFCRLVDAGYIVSGLVLLRFDGNLLRGEGRPAIKPATFTFLGFTHYLRKARSGPVNIERKPSVRARERFIRKVATWLKANKHLNVWD